MLQLGIIAELFSNEMDTLSNLVVVSKSSRLCKADKFLEKQEKTVKMDPKNKKKLQKTQITGLLLNFRMLIVSSGVRNLLI